MKTALGHIGVTLIIRRNLAVLMLVLLAGSIVNAVAADGNPAAEAATEQHYDAARHVLVERIRQHVRQTSEYLGKTELNPQVMTALASVPRHEFVPEYLRGRAYEDRPLPIGHEQTISQPYIVAIMTDLLGIEPGCKVLDIGTGSGYQAAVLAQICESVFSIEIVEPLGVEARERLRRLGYDNIEVRIGDGFYGWPEQAPFDAIIVAAAAGSIPDPLVDQLKPGGRMILPLNSGRGSQDLVLIEKSADGAVSSRDILPVLFVPLTGEHD
jgi:protein-L-isoaspartate(D-aspartate) O-methyltransferase